MESFYQRMEQSVLLHHHLAAISNRIKVRLPMHRIYGWRKAIPEVLDQMFMKDVELESVIHRKSVPGNSTTGMQKKM